MKKSLLSAGVAVALFVVAPSAYAAGNVANGAKLFQAKGCVACHTIDGTPRVGPTLKGVGNRKTIVIEGGAEKNIVADEKYLVNSIKNPNAQVVKGFPAAMVVPGGPLTDPEIADVVAYLLTLK